MNHCYREPFKRSSPESLQAVVEAYLNKKASGEERYLQFYRIQRTLADAVAKSAMAELPDGKRFSHQRRIPRRALLKAKRALLMIDLRPASSFDELHELVSNTIRPIQGIGPLAVYDTAHRIGSHLGLRPQFVYVHAGVRDGVKALGLDHRADKLPMSAFPKAFQRLKPGQVEDCLCIHKRELKNLRGVGV